MTPPLRSTRSTRRSAPGTGSATSPPTRWPTSCRRSRTCTSRSTGVSTCAARTRPSDSGPTPTSCSGSWGARPRTCRRSSPSSAARRPAGSPISRGRSWAWSSRRSSRLLISRRSSRACRRRRSSASTRSCGRPSGTCCRARSAARCSPSTAESGASSPTSSRTPPARSGSATGNGSWRSRRTGWRRLVDCIRRLRETKARLYTKEEVPFVTGIRKSVAEAFADLA